MPIDPRNDSATRGGFTRRTGLAAAAWSAPVVAAAVSAPGAAASTTPPLTGPFVGVFVINGENPGQFLINVRVGGPGSLGSRQTIAVECRVDIVSEHDVEVWGTGIIPDGPRAGHILTRPGTYPTQTTTTLRDGSKFAVGELLPTPISVFTAEPKGTFRVTATLTTGPGYTGPEASIYPVLGSGTSSVSVPTS